MAQPAASHPPLLTRLALAWRCFWQTLLQPAFARQLEALCRPASAPAAAPAPPPPPPEQVHAPALRLLALLQREGRLVDFLQEDVAGFSDAEVGAAARVVHAGCRQVLLQGLTLEPVLREPDGAAVTVTAGFDAQRIRLSGNVTGSPPFRGQLRHHGWAVTAVKLPTVADTLDPRVLAPAEIEL